MSVSVNSSTVGLNTLVQQLSESKNSKKSAASSIATLTQQLNEFRNASKSSLVDILNNDENSLTETLFGASSDIYSISAISSSLGSISQAAQKNGVSEVMNNVQKFALSLKDNGYDTLASLKLLSTVKDLAANDPEKFTEMFSGNKKTDANSTISELTKK